MTALQNKILSYNPDWYFKWNEAGGWPLDNIPINSGTAGVTPAWTRTNAAAYYSSDGPDGDGSWAWGFDTTEDQVRYIGNGTGPLDRFDGDYMDYSVGFWFKIPIDYTNDTTTFWETFKLLDFDAYTSNYGHIPGVQLYIRGEGTDRGKLQYLLKHDRYSTSPYIDHEKFLADGEWHYISYRAQHNGPTPETASLAKHELYLDGELIDSDYAVVISSATNQDIWLGDNFIGTPLPFDVHYSHFYIDGYDNIDATAMSEIYASVAGGGAVDIEITETPATASALAPTIFKVAGDSGFAQTAATASSLFVDPTIVTFQQQGHTEVVTSITASMTMPSPVISTQTFVNIVISELLEATAEMDEHIAIISQSFSFDPEPMVANSLFPQPILPVFPMTGSAQMQNPSLSIPVSYFQQVAADNPHTYIFDGSSSPYNGGYETGSVFTMGDLETLVPSEEQLSFIADGVSWKIPIAATSNSFLAMDNPVSENDWRYSASTTMNYSVECWVLPGTGTQRRYVNDTYLVRLYVESNGKVYCQFRFGLNLITSITSTVVLNSQRWNHIVATSEMDGSNTATYKLWINGVLAGIDIRPNIVPWSLDYTTFPIRFGDRDGGEGGIKFDEVALYTDTLSNSRILAHYDFIENFDPNNEYTPATMESSSTFVNPQFAATIDSVNAIAPFVANVLEIPQPIVIPGFSLDFVATAITSQALMVNPSIDFDFTISVDEAMIASAENPGGIVFDNQYFTFVTSNYQWYRYATFDSAVDPNIDFGNDTKYSVPQIGFGGALSGNFEGINNRSVLTAGNSYVTDGVIFYESEYDDDWGTGANEYAANFWFRRAYSDTSTTGIRILWNLHGENGNQHVILYQYQNKLFLNLNNGSGTYLEYQSDPIDLFDYARHMITITFTHTGSNTFVNVYVDGVVKIVADIHPYTGSTTNSDTYLPPNDLANNFPRMSVGCLVTPFVSTTLPLVPTNTKIYVDEVAWIKDELTLTDVIAIYDAMPPVVALTYEVIGSANASAEMLEPTISTSTSFLQISMTGSATMPTISSVSADRSISLLAEIGDASADIGTDAYALTGQIVEADVMVASAVLEGFEVIISIPGGPMTASTLLANNYVDGIKIVTNLNYGGYALSPYEMASPWATWLRGTEIGSIYPTREVV